MTDGCIAPSDQPQAHTRTFGSHEGPDFADEKGDGIDIRVVFEIGGKNHAREFAGLRGFDPRKRVRVDRCSGLRSDLSGHRGIFF